MQNSPNNKVTEDIFIIDTDNLSELHIVQQCIDIVGVFVCAIDLEGKIAFINKKGREVLACNGENVIGTGFIDNFVVDAEKNNTRKIFKSLTEDPSSAAQNTKYHCTAKVKATM
ncbi:MAG: hypothetical protein HC896_04175 [Bacteroidales bacterium]|nr:hypothetical protein [Bacteroidales bacterium]